MTRGNQICFKETMNMGSELIVSFELDGTHFWPNAPKKYEEFSHPHRHLFKFICWKPVEVKSNVDRPIELWELRKNTISIIEQVFCKNENGVVNFADFSCEGIANYVKDSEGFSKVFCGEEWFLGAIVC